MNQAIISLVVYTKKACFEICVETDRPTNQPTDPDTDFKMVHGRTIITRAMGVVKILSIKAVLLYIPFKFGTQDKYCLEKLDII